MKERRILDLTKVIIEIKDKKDDTNSCNVEIKMQGYDKGTKNEKDITAVVYNAVNETITNLKNIG